MFLMYSISAFATDVSVTVLDNPRTPVMPPTGFAGDLKAKGFLSSPDPQEPNFTSSARHTTAPFTA